MLRFPFRCIRQMTMCHRELLWRNGETLTVGFLATNQCTAPNTTADPALRAAVKEHAPAWEPYANIKFKFLDDPEATSADIRIEMVDLPKTSYSTVGNAARYGRLPDLKGSMFLQGSLSDTELGRVIMYEFGHTLGAGHEHQRPDTGIAWNEFRVFLDYLKRKRETDGIISNVFDVNSTLQYSPEEMSIYDRFSIMHYPIPAGYTTNNIVVNTNKVLSEKDKTWIARYYPHPPPGVGTFTFTPRNEPKKIPLAHTYPTPPDITFALTSLQFSNGTDLCVSAQATNYHQSSCDVHPHSDSEAHELGRGSVTTGLRHFSTSATNSEARSTTSRNRGRPGSGFSTAGATWLETPSDGRIFKVGVCNAEPNGQGEIDCEQTITPPPYLGSDPVVIVWLNSIHCTVGGRTPTKIKVSTSKIVSTNNFKIHIKSSGGSKFTSASASWVAYPKDMPGVVTGDIIPTTDLKNSQINFLNNPFTQVPKVLLAVNELDFDGSGSVNFNLTMSDVNTYSAVANVSAHVGATYLALAS